MAYTRTKGRAAQTKLVLLTAAGILAPGLLLSCGATQPAPTSGSKKESSRKEPTSSSESMKSEATCKCEKEEKKEEGYEVKSASDLLGLYGKIEGLKVEVEKAKAAIEDREAFFPFVAGLPAKALEVKKLYDEVKSVRVKVAKLTRTIEVAVQDVAIAAEKNWRLGKEAMLYIFTLKWFWGLFTGYHPTTSTTEQVERLVEVRKVVSKELEEAKHELRLLEGRFMRALRAMEVGFDEVMKKTSSPTLKNEVLSSKLALVRTFEGLLRAGKEEDYRWTAYREGLRIKHPTVPFSIASNIAISPRDYFGHFHHSELKRAIKEGEGFEHALKLLFSITEEKEQPLSMYSPTVIVTSTSKRITEAKKKLGEIQGEIAKIMHAIKKGLAEEKIAEEFEAPEFREAVANQKSSTESMLEGVKQSSARNVQFFQSVDRLRNALSKSHTELSKALSIEEQIQTAKDLVVLREQALRTAERTGYSFFRELGLYILGFKWLWGGAVGYAPTVSTTTEEEALAEARQALETKEKLHREELEQLKSSFERSLLEVSESLKAAMSEASGRPGELSVLLKFQTKFQTVVGDFRRALEEYTGYRHLYLHEQASADSFLGFGILTFLRQFSSTISGALATLPTTVNPYVRPVMDVVQEGATPEIATPETLSTLSEAQAKLEEAKREFDAFFEAAAATLFSELTALLG